METNTLQAIVEQLKIELSSVIPLKKLNTMNEYLADQCDVMRMTLIRDEFRSSRMIDQAYYQKVDCEDSMLTCYSEECTINGVTFTPDTEIYELEIPTLVTGVFNRNIKIVANPTLNTTITRVSFGDFIHFESEYSKPGPIYTLAGSNKLLFRNLSTAGMRFVSIWALLASPRKNCGWKSTDPYPVPSIYKLKLLVKKDILSVTPKQPNPKEDDSDKEDQ